MDMIMYAVRATNRKSGKRSFIQLPNGIPDLFAKRKEAVAALNNWGGVLWDRSWLDVAKVRLTIEEVPPKRSKGSA